VEELAPRSESTAETVPSRAAPPQSARPARARRSRTGWTGPLTGLWIERERVEATSGSCLRGTFAIERWAEREVAPNEAPSAAVSALLAAGSLSRAHVAVAVPSERLTTRVLRLPTQSPREIRSMIPYQLARELPVDLSRVSWTAAPIEELADGSSIVRVEIVRRDHLDAWLEPVRRAGATVWAAIPEGEIIAHRVARAIPARHERAFLVVLGDAHHLVLERGGALLFHRRLARPDAEDLRAAAVDARRRTGRDLPVPLSLLADDDARRATAAGLAQAAGLRALPVAAPPDEEGAGLAESVAAVAAARGAGLLAEATRRELAHGAMRRALARTAMLGVAVLGLAALFLGAMLYRTERRVELLRDEVAQARGRMEEVDRMRDRLDELAAPDADTDILRAISSLRESLAAETRVQTFHYTADGRVVFTGTSPSLGLVHDLEEKLEAAGPWADVSVVRLQRARGDVETYQFEVQGRLSRGGAR